MQLKSTAGNKIKLLIVFELVKQRTNICLRPFWLPRSDPDVGVLI